jgi:UDP-glucose:glycoprotein glucosyltransferase
LHTAVPRIEAYYDYYATRVDDGGLGTAGCEAWVEWRGKGFCGVEELKRDIEQSLGERGQT